MRIYLSSKRAFLHLVASKIILVKIILVIGAGLIVGSAFAEPAERGDGKGCAGDVKKFCADVKPGQGRVDNCLKQSEAKLSAGCKKSRSQARSEAEKVADECREDAKKFCSDVEPGEGRRKVCLESNSKKLSPACRKSLGKTQG